MPSVFVTWMSLTVAAGQDRGRDGHRGLVGHATDSSRATPPNVTVAPATKWVPVSVTIMPPAGGPERGLDA